MLAAVTQPYLSELYGVKTDYFVDLNNLYYGYYDTSKTFYYSNTNAINEIDDFKNIITREGQVCVLVRGPSKMRLLGKKGLNIIEKEMIEVENYKKMKIYCKN